MSAEILRRAATEMRARATACISNHPVTDDERPWFLPEAFTSRRVADADDAAHLASWTPDVALDVAEWLESEVPAAMFREGQADRDNAIRLRPEPFPVYYDKTTQRAIAVARTYLGDEA